MAPTIKSLHSVYIWSEALKVWIWRMLKISWKDKATNEQAVEKVKEERSMLNTIWKRNHRRLGHMFRNEVLFWKIIEGRKKGRALHGWKRPLCWVSLHHQQSIWKQEGQQIQDGKLYTEQECHKSATSRLPKQEDAHSVSTVNFCVITYCVQCC